MKRRFSLALLGCAAALISAPRSQGQAFTTLYSFSTSNQDGQNPASTLLLADGKLYGTTVGGGIGTQNSVGTVFQMDLKGNEVVLYRFDGITGLFPEAGVVRDAAGNLYGTASEGGAYNFGTVFKLDTAGTATVLHNFTGGADGGNPFAGVTLDAKGNLYGTTLYGGDLNCGLGCGTVFKVDASGTLTVLYTFTGGNDGLDPYVGSLLLDPAGNLIGTAIGGGAFGQGTIFKVHPDGTETTLYSFTGGADGGAPYSGLVKDNQGNLYGTTSQGGSGKRGTVYKLNSKGQETVLYSFARGTSDGDTPYAGVVLDAKGNLYGTTAYGGTNGYGIVFEVSQNGEETVLRRLLEPRDGSHPTGGLVMDSKGNLYGTAYSGGKNFRGTVFKVTP